MANCRTLSIAFLKHSPSICSSQQYIDFSSHVMQKGTLHLIVAFILNIEMFCSHPSQLQPRVLLHSRSPAEKKHHFVMNYGSTVHFFCFMYMTDMHSEKYWLYIVPENSKVCIIFKLIVESNKGFAHPWLILFSQQAKDVCLTYCVASVPQLQISFLFVTRHLEVNDGSHLHTDCKDMEKQKACIFRGQKMNCKVSILRSSAVLAAI